MPCLDIGSSITNVPHLTDLDIDLHMPLDINFNYYSAHEFHSNYDIS